MFVQRGASGDSHGGSTIVSVWGGACEVGLVKALEDLINLARASSPVLVLSRSGMSMLRDAFLRMCR